MEETAVKPPITIPALEEMLERKLADLGVAQHYRSSECTSGSTRLYGDHITVSWPKKVMGERGRTELIAGVRKVIEAFYFPVVRVITSKSVTYGNVGRTFYDVTFIFEE